MNRSCQTVDLRVRKVGPGLPCLVIAEAGVNHNGKLALARKLIDAAAQCGADVVKFQTWITEELVGSGAPMAEYQTRACGTGFDQFRMLKQLELDHAQFRRLKTHAKRRKICFASTPDEADSADFLDQLGVPFFKIGSAEIPNLPLLRHVARKGRPVVLSTGMATLAEVETAIRTMEGAGNRNIVLLHCVSDYPASASESNLRAMDTLAAAFGYPVGFSDHTLGIEIALAAVARGACVLEKHLTLDKNMEGPDHAASLDPAEFAAMVSAIRTVESALGDGIKRPSAAELEIRKVVVKSVVLANSVKAGRKLRASDLCLRRSSPGLPPTTLPALIGRRTARDLPAGAVLANEDLQ
jgi:N,N'-diacetyllegionaminate synthase